MHRRFCLLMCLVLLMTGWTASFAQATEVKSAPLVRAGARNGMVRVHLSSMGDVSSLDVTIAGSYSTAGAQNMHLVNGETVNISFDRASGQISLNRHGQSYDMGREMAFRRHEATGSNGLRIAQTRMPENLYPGDLYLKAQKSGSGWKLYAIVHVYIEYYLYGVVPYEMGNSANMEALKAQAVAARTYTLNKMNLRADSLYDVVDTTMDQVYYGSSDTTANCTAAVDATKGIVAMNGDALTGTYYTASNGGQTESARNGLNASGYDYLGVKDDPFDLMNSASVKRQVTVTADNTSSAQNESLRTLLNTKAQNIYGSGAQVTRIHGITPHTPMYAAPSRLYTKLDFDVSVNTGARTPLTLDIFSELEKVLGMSINSRQNELWTVESYNDSFKLVARRFGHGVGMSQRGAMQMGAEGYTYDQILGFYYEDCRRVQHTFTHTVLSALESGGSDTIVNTETPADITNGSGNTATVRLAGVNDRLAIRSGASKDAQVLTSVVNGGMVTVLAKGSSWTLVQLGQIIGYAPTSALKFSGNPPTSSDAAPTVISQWAEVDCNGTLNLRTSPSLSAGVKATIPDGAVLCVFETQAGWAKVQYGAQVGWVSMDFLKMRNTYPGQTTGQGSMQAVVNIPGGTGAVNLRETPSTTSRVLTTIPHGGAVTVLTNDGSWCSVQVQGQQGYIMTRYLSIGGQVAPAPEEDDEAPSLGENGTEAIVKTASGTLNLRAQPNTAAKVLMTIPRGESIIVTSRGEQWCAVRYAGISGYVMTQFLSFPMDDELEPASYAVVATQSGTLNMRSQPTTGSAVVLQIPKGARVGIVSQMNGWSHVRYNGRSGYVMSSYLRAENAVPETSGRYATVTTSSGSLNLRETPSAKARVLLAIPRGTMLEILSHSNGWAEVKHNGVHGYVMDKFLTFTDEAPDSQPSEGRKTTVSTGGGGLNLREAANVNARVLLSIPNGAQVGMLTEGNEWCKVVYNGVTGYAMTRFLKLEAAVTGVWLVHTPSGGLNLRETASADARVLLSIPRGTAVTMLEQGSDWCRIQYNDHVGYVMTKYLLKE